MTPRKLLILEGPDGSGKSRLAARLAERLDALVVHCGPFPRIQRGLARLYAEAMLPALLGYQTVILDRAWPSEAIYGRACRGGADRLNAAQVRMLERLALRCEVAVVRCLPPVEACLTTFRRRKGEELLEREAQLREVWEGYRDLQTALPVVTYDYTQTTGPGAEARATEDVLACVNEVTPMPHPLASGTGGHLGASYVLVGETLGGVKEHDPLLARAPFVSFGEEGCSEWLTRQLIDVRSERELLWANADDPWLELVIRGGAPRRRVVALGEAADVALDVRQIEHVTVSHPQHHKRFNHTQPYPLADLLTEAS